MLRIAIYTKNFRVYYRIISLLKRMDISFSSITDGKNLGAFDIVFSDEFIEERNVIVTDGLDEFRIRQVIFGANSKEIVVGIDPGPTPGIATLADNFVIDKRNIYSFEEVRKYVQDVHSQCKYKNFKIKVGNGDKINRDKIIKALRGFHYILVNEKGSSKTIKRGNDWEAAINIAMSDKIM